MKVEPGLEQCFLCKGRVTAGCWLAAPRRIRAECPVCGPYEMLEQCVQTLLSEPDTPRYLLSGAVREKALKEAPPLIRSIEELLQSVVPPAVPIEALDRLVLYLQSGQNSANQYISLDSAKDYPVAYAKGPEEFSYFVGLAKDLGYLEADRGGSGYRLGIEGWKRLAELRKDKSDSDRAFVAMWFDSTMEDPWKSGIEPALVSAGYKPVRIDLVDHNEKICDRIIAEIRKSSLVVADFTGQRGGVYFEAGFAMGLGIPVIWLCSDADVKNLHFDTRQYNHIVWRDAADLRAKLLSRIEATAPVKSH